jgi:hypothetical protein
MVKRRVRNPGYSCGWAGNEAHLKHGQEERVKDNFRSKFVSLLEHLLHIFFRVVKAVFVSYFPHYLLISLRKI